ncbi:MAG: putative dehydrogenase [Gammaproteobacteria bacterium]|jgi:predicted dehydrogenase
MVKEARHLVQKGKIGTIRKVIVEYPQGWLTTNLEATDQKQAAWRTDPKRSGIAGAMGDIGTHAENLAEYITGLQITKLCADLNTFVPGRRLDDDGNVLLEFDNGAKGILFATQIAAGEENNLKIRIYGTKAGLEWAQMEPNSLQVKWLDKPLEILRTGVGKLSKASLAHTRIPAGHPEGYLEAFANIYRNFAFCLQADFAKKKVNALYEDYPRVDDGVRGMQFIERVVASGKSKQKWVKF